MKKLHLISLLVAGAMTVPTLSAAIVSLDFSTDPAWPNDGRIQVGDGQEHAAPTGGATLVFRQSAETTWKVNNGPDGDPGRHNIGTVKNGDQTGGLTFIIDGSLFSNGTEYQLGFDYFASTFGNLTFEAGDTFVIQIWQANADAGTGLTYDFDTYNPFGTLPYFRSADAVASLAAETMLDTDFATAWDTHTLNFEYGDIGGVAAAAGGDVIIQMSMVSGAAELETENDVFVIDNFSVTQVPEPSTVALLAGLGAIGLGIYRRRR